MYDPEFTRSTRLLSEMQPQRASVNHPLHCEENREEKKCYIYAATLEAK